jgi:hypothetical protein
MWNRLIWPVAYPGNFSVGVQQIQLRTENGDLMAVANLQMSETRILVRFLWMYFPRNWEFDSVLSKFHNFFFGAPLDMARNRIQWQAVVHIGMNIQVTYKENLST